MPRPHEKPMTRERYESSPHIGTYENYLLWFRRSQAANKAVETKRKRYKTWPTRRGDHK